MTEDSKKTGATAASKTTKPKSSKSTATRKTAATTSKKTGTRSTPAKSRSTGKQPAKKATSAGTGEMVTIDGKKYPVDALSDNAKAQITNLRATDRIIEDLEAELAISRTARASYAKELENELANLNTTIQ